MIEPQHAVNIVLKEAARSGRADETMVLVTEKVEATLRWAGNSMTTNGVSHSRNVTVISIVRRGDSAFVGSVVSAEVDPSVLPGLVVSSQDAARSAPEAGDAAPLLADTGEPDDWDAPVPGTGAGVFTGIAGSLSRGFRGADRLYGYAHRSVSTTFLASSTGLRRRYTQPTGAIEINAKRGDASAWVGIGTPDFVEVPIDLMLERLSTRLRWAQRTVELPAGRYQTIMPPSTVADMMIYLGWSMAGRGAQEGRTAFSAPGGGTRVGERLTELPLTLFTDPAAPGLACTPFVAVSNSSETQSVFDNGMEISQVDWIRSGVINALAYPRATAAKFDAPVAVAADNLIMTGGARMRALDPVTSELVRLRGAAQHNCRVCKSLREVSALDAGGSETLYGEIERFDTSVLLDVRAKAALRYADALIWTPAHLAVDVAVEVRSRFSDDEAVELTFDIMRNASNKVAVSLGADAPRVQQGTERYRIGLDGQTVFG